jgi:hypothetical protein
MSDVIKVNFVQGRDYLQDVAVYAAQASNAAQTATNAANSAQQSANLSAQSANLSAQSANSSSGYANNASSSATEASGYANNASDSADQSEHFAEVAQQAAENAQTSETNASDSATQANTQANNAAESAQQAQAALAGIAAYSAPAWDSTTVYSYPAVVAYTDGNTYRCIGNNVAAGTIPVTSTDWVRISVLGGDDFFEIDMQGSLMPSVNPTFAYSWQLDSDGNIMPRAASDTLGTEINTYAEEALKTSEQALATANESLARANSILYEGIPVELDSDGNVTTTADNT